MYCPICGTPNADTSRFCQKCGSPLPVVTLPNQPATPPLPTGESAPPRSRSGLWLIPLVLAAIATVTFTIIYVTTQTGPSDNALVEQLASIPDSINITPTALTIPTATPQPSATPLPTATPTPTQTPLPTATPTPTPCPDLSPYFLDADRMKRLGCPGQDFVPSRTAILQRFQKGVMVIFAKPSNTFDNKGGALIYALANDGRAWRMVDAYIETSPNRPDWYSCDVKSNDGPEVTGVPWRGFGKAWCEHPEVRAALGKALTGEEGDVTASFQSYTQGRAFKLSDWRGFPGWNTNRVYIVYWPTTEGDYFAGTWEAQ